MSQVKNQDYYAILGVSHTASKADIAKAYKSLAARYHPDLHEENELKDLAREKMDQLNLAYEVLSDQTKRTAYDRERLSNPMYQRPETKAPRVLPRFLLLLGLMIAAILVMRFIPNPRVSTVVAIAVAVIWFGPRIVRYFFNKKS
ncbi:MAG: J domain-containing protein [Proteobacteria bacterium]|nr:J domain-containing protein [Pseudomonadota bacterium]